MRILESHPCEDPQEQILTSLSFFAGSTGTQYRVNRPSDSGQSVIRLGESFAILWQSKDRDLLIRVIL